MWPAVVRVGAGFHGPVDGAGFVGLLRAGGSGRRGEHTQLVEAGLQ